MFGIIDKNKKFILLDENFETLRTTALMLAKQTDDGYIPMFTEENVNDFIKEYSDSDIETSENGDKYFVKSDR